MKHFVERTCTVVRRREEERGGETVSSRRGEARSQPLESFREAAAYVLLGSPGAGKTEAFRREAGREGGHYVTARDFLTFDPEPEWEGRTVYIDGLDETRAGASGGRTPFDGIRGKLHRLGRPPFRISCRAADWFGSNDRERLKAVAPNGEVQELRLDPLSDHGVFEILERNHDVTDPAAFVAEARTQGVEDLLRNPQNLRMLAEAVAEANEEWPRTRVETFDMACRKLVTEENPEHQIAWRGTVDTATLLDRAGDLFALLLLAGKAGVTLPGSAADPNHPRLDHVPRGDQQLLRRVVRTGLFTSPSEGRLAPEHRQIAEFLAACHLATRIADGLPVGRVLALMTGFDGGIISECRGLAAWLAALSAEARADIIERDPLGVVLYGDVRQFGPGDKRLVFQALKGETRRNPWLVYSSSAGSPLRPLAGPDLEDDMRQALTDPARDEAHQSFVLLIAAAIRDAAPRPGLADPLMAIVRDDSWAMHIRDAALEAYMRAGQDDPRISVTLRRLLDDVHAGAVPTKDDNLLGILLAKLYPNDLPVADIVNYLRQPPRRNLWTRYGRFWTNGLIEKSTVPQMVQLLDLLQTPMEKVRAECTKSQKRPDLVARTPNVLLRHLLERSPQSVSPKRIVYWFGFAAWLELSFGSMVRDAEYFRNWLSGGPDKYKAIVEHGVNRCREEDLPSCMRRVKRSLLEASPPLDYGFWCVDQALSAEDAAVARWFVQESAEFVFHEKRPSHRQRDVIARKLRDEPRLGRLFEARLRDLEEDRDFPQGKCSNPEARPAPNDARFNELREVFKKNESALRGNECRANLLNTLAVAYFDGFSDVSGETPKERLQCLLGPNDDLLEAARAGLRGAIRRPDLPMWTEVSKLAGEGRTHYLAYPFMAGLQERSDMAETSDCQLDDAQTRLAVAIHVAVPRMRRADDWKRPPRWLRGCLARDPGTVAEVWSHCVGAQLRRGNGFVPDTDRLARERGYGRFARAASAPLLKVFPIRCKAGQLPILANILAAAIAHGDSTQLVELIDSKLAYRSMNSGQRVYWLTAGLLLQPAAYGDRLESYVSGNVRRIQRLAEMTCGPAVLRAVADRMDATVSETLIRVIGPYTTGPPNAGRAYRVTWPIQADETLHSFIDRLSEGASEAAEKALESLSKDDRLANWRSRLLDRLHRQKSVRREATFAHPSLDQVAEVLERGRPLNAADLAAFTSDKLHRLARSIRDCATSDWRQYWNVDQYNRALKPKPENACRDGLLSDLRQELAALGIDAMKEGSYADDKQSDIRVASSVGGFNVPVEIKRSCHRELWSAIRTQLIAKYTRDPGADGYGIYLVFWFGDAGGCHPTPRSGPRPRSSEELRQALLDTLTDTERRKISVCVIDVSKPQA